MYIIFKVVMFGQLQRFKMKHPIMNLKYLLVAGLLGTLAWNCSEETTNSTINATLVGGLTVCSPARHLYVGEGQDYIIYPDNIVTDGQGTTIGLIKPNADGITYSIVTAEGTLFESVPLQDLEVLDPTMPTYKIHGDAWHLLTESLDYLIYLDGMVYNANDELVAVADLTNLTAVSIYRVGDNALITTADFSNLHVFHLNDKCTVDALNPPESSASIASSETAPVVGTSSETAPVVASSDTPAPESHADQPKSSANAKSSSSQVKSSSSAKSSSSVVKSSSSVSGNASCPKISYINGGASGSGWATRYWDCCKPSCSWPQNTGYKARQCDRSGKNQNNNYDEGSICNGGGASTCLSQIPFTIDGCSDMAFAFAAVPASNGGQCGHCYELTFTGEGHYSSTNANTKAIKGKKLIVMASNIGGDVQQGQFDVMIPGGGVGAFNGCNGMGWGAQGEQYGGLLSDCEKETNYAAGRMASCLKKKCESVFANDAQAKEGCLFLADWMHAAGNPEHTYKEVECPQVLKDKY